MQGDGEWLLGSPGFIWGWRNVLGLDSDDCKPLWYTKGNWIVHIKRKDFLVYEFYLPFFLRQNKLFFTLLNLRNGYLGVTFTVLYFCVLGYLHVEKFAVFYITSICVLLFRNFYQERTKACTEWPVNQAVFKCPCVQNLPQFSVRMA